MTVMKIQIFNPFQPFSQGADESRESFFKESVYELFWGKFMKVLMPEIIKMNCT